MNSESLDSEAMRLLALAFEQPSGTQSAWIRTACKDDAALEQRVLGLLKAHETDASYLKTGGATSDQAESPVPERIGAYRITGLIGEGGMGAVYLGERDAGDFDHRVAIKVIRKAVLREELTARFEQERQILARLNHPGIARLFDGGTLEDGSPFMVMELVDGQPITDWVREQSLAVKPRLHLFIELCRAVQHAHQNLIIHRDLTPSNVLVTRSGSVKLIDFGIAKPHTDDVPPQASAGKDSLSHTKGFAAPERHTGAAANMLADIYSLGKILKALLAKTPDDADLSAIIGRATAHDPADRYSGCEALIADLSAYLTGHGVKARQGGHVYEFRKFIGRHTIGTALASLATITLALGLAAMTNLYRTAEANRVAADERFEDVRSLAKFMMFDLYDSMIKTPGNTESIASLAKESQVYLDALSSGERASLDVRIEALRGYQRLADILGNSKNTNLGLTADTSQILTKALAEAEALYAQYPDNPDVMRALGEVAFSYSVHAFVSEDETEKSEQLAKTASGAYERLIVRPDVTFEDKRQAIRAYMMTGVPLTWVSRHEEGLEILKTAYARGRALRTEYPDSPEARDLLGSLSVEIARALVRYSYVSKGAPDSLPYWDDAIRLRLESDAANPEDKRPYRSLAAFYYERAAALRALERFDEAFADLERGRIVAETMIAQDPDDEWVRIRLDGIAQESVRTLSYAGRHAEAVARADDVLALVRIANTQRSGDRESQRTLGYSLVLFASVYVDAGDLKKGCALTREARSVWDEFARGGAIGDHDKTSSIAELTGLESRCAKIGRP